MFRSATTAVLVSAMAAVLTAAIPATPAAASVLSNEVPCTSSDYLRITIHVTDAPSEDRCIANGGEMDVKSSTRGADMWLTRISTGKNRVQWHGDKKWQPSTPIGKRTVFTFPNHPGGVRIDKIRIL